MHITEIRIAMALLIAVSVCACSKPASEMPAAAPTSARAPASDTSMAGMPMDSHGIVIADPQSRPTPPLATVGVVYLSITNHGMSVDRLLGASSPVAERVELHANSMEGGITRMRPVESLELAPHHTTVMDPGGMHFMLTNLAAPLVAGEHFPLTLRFETAGEITVTVVVQEDSGTNSDAHQHEHG